MSTTTTEIPDTAFWYQLPMFPKHNEMIRMFQLMVHVTPVDVEPIRPCGYVVTVWDKYNHLGPVSTGYKCDCGEFREFRPLRGTHYPFPPFDMARAHAERHAQIARFN